jgi:hypothetical protein
MDIALARLSALALRARSYLPVLMMALAAIGFVKGFNPLDTGGGTGG